MAAGSVVVDMGASALGGNVAGSQPGETVVTENGVTVIGAANLPSTMPTAASAMYARNISSLLLYLVKDGALAVDLSDDLQRGVVITYEGQVVHPALAECRWRYRRCRRRCSLTWSSSCSASGWASR